MVIAVAAFWVVSFVIAGWISNATTKRLARRITALEWENLRLAKAIKVIEGNAAENHAILVNGNAELAAKVTNAITQLEVVDSDLAATLEGINQRVQTLEGKQPSAVVKPKRMNFRQFRNAVENASEPQETESLATLRTSN